MTITFERLVVAPRVWTTLLYRTVGYVGQVYFDRDCCNHDTGNNVSDHFRWAIFCVFGNFFPIINAKEWCYRIYYGALFCCPLNCECTDRSTINFEQVFARKMHFPFVQPKKPLSVSANCVPIFENDHNRGQPLAKTSMGQTIWHVCCVFRFLGYLVQK